MKLPFTIALLIAAAALGACDDKAPEPKYEALPPVISGIGFPLFAPGSQLPRAELSQAQCVHRTRG